MSKDVAEAITYLANTIDRAVSGTSSRMGVIESNGAVVRDAGVAIAEALDRVATAIASRPDYTETIESLTDALHAIAVALKNR